MLLRGVKMGRNIQARPIRTSYQKKLEKFTSSLGKAISKVETIPLQIMI